MTTSLAPADRRDRLGRRTWIARVATLCLLLLPTQACGAPVDQGVGGLDEELVHEEPSIRVGILVDTVSVTLSSTTRLDFYDYTGSLFHSVPSSTPVVIRTDDRGELLVETGGAPIATGAVVLGAHPTGDGLIEIGGRLYRGGAQVRIARATRVTAINTIPLELYLRGVVPAEIEARGDSLIEAAKAQAVVARTYAIANLGRWEMMGFDFYGRSYDQEYGGSSVEDPIVTRAVEETSGQIVAHEGRPIQAYYHSTCAGKTVAVQEAWPDQPPQPYLVSVSDVNPATGQAFDARSTGSGWTVRWDVDSLERILSRSLASSGSGALTGELRDVRVTARNAAGRVSELRIATTTGERIIRGRENDIRGALLTPEGNPLNSTMFDIQIERNAAGEPLAVIASGEGRGHGVGMCQVGAIGRAAAGQSYRAILQSYFPGTEILSLY